MESNSHPVVILDFDCTLTFSHWYWFLNNLHKFSENKHWLGGYKYDEIESLSAEVRSHLTDLDKLSEKDQSFLIELIFGGMDRLQEVFRFLAHLEAYGCYLYISSRGMCDEIIPLIKKTGLDKFFIKPEEIININANGGLCVKGTKVDFIIAGWPSLRKKHPHSHLYYIDDDGCDNKVIATRYGASVSETYTYYGENIGLFKDNNGLSASQMDTISRNITGNSYSS